MHACECGPSLPWHMSLCGGQRTGVRIRFFLPTEALGIKFSVSGFCDRHFYHSSHHVFKNTKDFVLKVILKYSGSGSEDLRGGLPLGAEVERDLQEYRTFSHSFSRCWLHRHSGARHSSAWQETAAGRVGLGYWVQSLHSGWRRL